MMDDKQSFKRLRYAIHNATYLQFAITWTEKKVTMIIWRRSCLVFHMRRLTFHVWETKPVSVCPGRRGGGGWSWMGIERNGAVERERECECPARARQFYYTHYVRVCVCVCVYTVHTWDESPYPSPFLPPPPLPPTNYAGSSQTR